ncbi:hypothetical protein phi16_gp027 [Corynebacterium phage phi16]|uniref:hypothetical protein n=1 Tax=Corynebacterium glutamicum TaxID=1718 RepID=UPI0009426119|nr:hypothetical protein [Corynebacterium glutamicum]APQ42531.1 hypothetical protein phi16_gp027 [Corynebacterium phage phi16]OKX80475.1 hypothetical protein AUO95_09975 [Corynebacterium glutamicum]
MTTQAIATIIWNNDSDNLIESHEMIRDDNGNDTIAKIVTSTGHIAAVGTEEDAEGEYLTYSIYAPGDETMTDGPITTDGFEITSEEDAADHLAEILSKF